MPNIIRARVLRRRTPVPRYQIFEKLDTWTALGSQSRDAQARTGDVVQMLLLGAAEDGGIVLRYKPNNEEGHRRLIAKLKDLMQRQRKCNVHGHECHEGLFARNLFVGQRIPLAGVAHQVGTIRFGRDPRSSALDVNCRAHDLDNLYVVDGSFFPSSGAVNPALTIMANALRVGDHLLERLN